MAEWNGAFSADNFDSDPIAGRIKKLLVECGAPVDVVKIVAELTPTPPTLQPYSFAMYFALAMAEMKEASGIRVLDIGTFIGLYVGCLRGLGFRAEGIELDADHVDIAAKTGVDLLNGDAFRLSEHFGGESFDLITCVNFVDPDVFDTTEDRIVQLCGQCHSVLSPGGYLLINPPADLPFPRRRILEIGFERCAAEESYGNSVLPYPRHLVLRRK